jgi:hypothetical protein
MGTWPPRLGESQELGRLNMVFSPAGLRWRGPAATVNYRPVLSSERAYKITNPQLSKENFKEKEKLVAGPRWVPDTKMDWRLTVGRNLTSTSNEYLCLLLFTLQTAEYS